MIKAKHYSDQARKPDRLQYREKLWGAHRESLDQGTLGAFEVNEDDSFELVNDDQASENSESPSKGAKGPRPRCLQSSAVSELDNISQQSIDKDKASSGQAKSRVGFLRSCLSASARAKSPSATPTASATPRKSRQLQSLLQSRGRALVRTTRMSRAQHQTIS